jgi:hypothetical protein
MSELRRIHSEFVAARGLVGGLDAKRWRGHSGRGTLGVAGSYTLGGDFVRVWHLSDGRSLARITYLCEAEDGYGEVEVCEAVVERARFLGLPLERSQSRF